jgi:uncharacterized protein (DUF433 family)
MMQPEADRWPEAAVTLNDADLIARYIEPDPSRPSRAEARLKTSGVPVWALIGQYQATGRDLEAVAASYEVPVAAMRAALAYYWQHMELIEDRLAANAV